MEKSKSRGSQSLLLRALSGRACGSQRRKQDKSEEGSAFGGAKIAKCALDRAGNLHGAAFRRGRFGRFRLDHDPLNRSRTPAALCAAAQLIVNLACGARRSGGCHSLANGAVAQHITRAYDHNETSAGLLRSFKYSVVALNAIKNHNL